MVVAFIQLNQSKYFEIQSFVRTKYGLNQFSLFLVRLGVYQQSNLSKGLFDQMDQR